MSSLDFRPGDEALYIQAQYWHEDEDTQHMIGAPLGEPGKALAKIVLKKYITDPPENAKLVGVWKEGTPLAYVLYDQINELHRSADLHMVVNPEYQGRGYGRKVMSKALELGFDAGLYRLVWNPLKRNKVAINMAMKLGGVLECFTKSSFWIGESPADQAQIRILRSEFQPYQGGE